MRRLRRNPPLSEHMAHDSFDAIAHALAARAMRDPLGAAELAYSLVEAANMGVLRYRESLSEGTEESTRAIVADSLGQSLVYLQEAIALLEGE